ncbi:MAG TPA: ferredoxin [Oceanospirillaceae bacterium]|nr:ferredoxin [Oceanospirillaceae bacterium]
MTLVTFIQADGHSTDVQAEQGKHLMQLALDNGVAGITGACGGSCMCATCHVLVEQINGQLDAAGEMEVEILDMEVDEVFDNSRLCCQISVSAAIESITVRIPPNND